MEGKVDFFSMSLFDTFLGSVFTKMGKGEVGDCNEESPEKAGKLKDEPKGEQFSSYD